MRAIATFLSTALLALAGCGAENDSGTRMQPVTTGDGAATEKTKSDDPPAKPGTTIRTADSEFGEMLFDSKRQAIYIFENDPKGKSVCYGACAEAWPPVLTEGEPRAARGADKALLGTIERRDGRRQVTYAGKPLYFYAHEQPGEVRCHNVHLNGGYWWVVGPDGERRP